MSEVSGSSATVVGVNAGKGCVGETSRSSIGIESMESGEDFSGIGSGSGSGASMVGSESSAGRSNGRSKGLSMRVRVRVNVYGVMVMEEGWSASGSDHLPCPPRIERMVMVRGKCSMSRSLHHPYPRGHSVPMSVA